MTLLPILAFVFAILTAAIAVGIPVNFWSRKRRAAHQLVRKAISPRNGYGDWEITQLIANVIGLNWTYTHPSQIMDGIAQLTATFKGVSCAGIEDLDSVQWPCNDANPAGSPATHINGFSNGRGKFVLTECA